MEGRTISATSLVRKSSCRQRWKLFDGTNTGFLLILSKPVALRYKKSILPLLSRFLRLGTSRQTPSTKAISETGRLSPEKSRYRNVGFCVPLTTANDIRSKLSVETETDAKCPPNPALHVCQHFHFVRPKPTARNHSGESRRLFRFARVLERKWLLGDSHSGPTAQRHTFGIYPS